MSNSDIPHLPSRKIRHNLSEIDAEKMRGICAICGPTDILKATTYRNQTFYRCATNIRKQARDHSRLHYKPASKS
jgi:ssDNA-binding Zn-finger/Zn-ribbon topoisomerase 1